MDIIDNYYELTLKQIANSCKEILEDAIQSEVYDKYSPKVYDRTNQLRDNVRVDVKNGFIYVYVNTGNMKYSSNSKNSHKQDISKWIPYWINYGHNIGGQGGNFMYDYYPSRNYLQKAKERIEKELGFEVEIIDNELV